ncbi:MAG: BLUF domain-containing protein [Pseudomonadota bacterium]
MNADDDLVTLTYISHSLIKPEKLPSELKRLETKASYANRQNEISGLLIHRQHRFIQRLEGRRSKIDALMEKIRADKRHRNINVIFYEKLNQRLYPNWSQMRVISGSKGTEAIDRLFINLETGNKKVLSNQQCRFIVSFVQNFDGKSDGKTNYEKAI